jgi:hemoglobin/transferrin/lactoferrin receptor protein
VRRNFALNGQDSIVYDGALSQVQAIQNAASAHVYGIQAGIELKLPAGLTLSSRFNLQKGQEELDDGSTAPLRHAGPWFGATHLIYRRDRLKADFYGVYNGEVSYEDLATEEQGKPHIYAIDAKGDPYSPGWYTLNLKVQYQLADLLMLSAGVENITDQRYRPYSSGIVAPGRNFIAAVKTSF